MRIIVHVSMLRWLSVVGLSAVIGCQASTQARVNIIDGDKVFSLGVSGQWTPASLLQRAGLSLQSGDALLLRGYPVDPQSARSAAGPTVLQIEPAKTLVVNGKPLSTTAATVGEALTQAGLVLYAADEVDPPAYTPASDGLKVTYLPSKQYAVSVDQRTSSVRSAQSTVGAVLADAGFPLLGLDFSQPAADQAPPPDGNIRVVRVTEAILLAEKPIPFGSQYTSSSQVELDHEQVLQPGQAGLAVTRTRIRYQDGQEVSRVTEPEMVVRPPVDRITAYGTKVVIHTATVDGIQIQYWRAIQMFATAYSPCNSAADRCYPGTSSGKPVQQGEVAVKYSWYLAMQGQALYIPGYGRATIEDVCGGCVGKPWIDLGYTDAQYATQGDQWGKYVTVYFLAPPPANVLDLLQ